MSAFKMYLNFTLLLVAAVVVNQVSGGSTSKLNLKESTCQLLNDKLVASNPWTEYPIVFEPIKRGRLTIWTGVSTLPTSEFTCITPKNSTNEVLLRFDNFANKLEWTFYDMNKGATYHGISVNHCEDVNYKISLGNRQMNSYLDCNTVDGIEQTNANETMPALRTICQECGRSLLELIDGQIRELVKLKLNDQIMDNLYWHITQLISSQHFSGPVSLVDGNVK